MVVSGGWNLLHYRPVRSARCQTQFESRKIQWLCSSFGGLTMITQGSAIDPAELAAGVFTSRQRGIGECKREEVRFLIRIGVPHAEVVRKAGVSSGTVSSIRQD